VREVIFHTIFGIVTLLALVLAFAFGSVVEDLLGITQGESRIIGLILIIAWGFKVMLDNAFAKIDRRLDALQKLLKVNQKHV
jgi:small neutral amino acid transporter SnatA (MarC family)